MRCLRKSVLSALAGSFVALATSAAQAGLVTIDDFNTPNANVAAGMDPDYTQSLVDIGTKVGLVPPTVVFDTTTNAGKLTYSYSGGTNNTQGDGFSQVVLLRDDWQLLNNGEYFQITVNINTPASGGSTSAGLAIAPLGASDKSKMAAIYIFSNQGRIRGIGPGGGLGDVNSVFSGTAPVHLRITRESSTSVQMSYSLDGLNFTQYSTPVTVDPLNTLAVGVFAGNGRSEAAQVANASWDNLVINQVPEPHSIAMAVMGLSGLAFCGWRAKGRK